MKVVIDDNISTEDNPIKVNIQGVDDQDISENIRTSSGGDIKQAANSSNFVINLDSNSFQAEVTYDGNQVLAEKIKQYDQFVETTSGEFYFEVPGVEDDGDVDLIGNIGGNLSNDKGINKTKPEYRKVSNNKMEFTIENVSNNDVDFNEEQFLFEKSEDDGIEFDSEENFDDIPILEEKQSSYQQQSSYTNQPSHQSNGNNKRQFSNRDKFVDNLNVDEQQFLYETNFEGSKAQNNNETYNRYLGQITVYDKLDHINGIELEGAQINLYKLTGANPTPIATLNTDSTGKAVFRDLDDGSYRVIAIVDKRYFERPEYFRWNEVNIDSNNKDDSVIVVNKIRNGLRRRR